MSENVFRAQLSSWRRSAGAISQSAAEETTSFMSRIRGMGLFGRDSSLRLPVSENEQVEEPGWFTLSRWDRLIVFGVCLAGAVLLFTLCFALLPVLAVKPRKFATIWSLGSLLFIISFGVLQGPYNFMVHLLSPDRILFTLAYFGSIIATLTFSLGLKSTILTLLAIIAQIIAALWYTLSYFPMGLQSLRFASRFGARQATSWINS